MPTPLEMEHPPPIQPLPPPTHSLLRSSIVLPSLPQTLLELAHNALDAHATRFTANIDLDTFTLRADDNGTGIPLAHLARLGSRYSTSKLACSTGSTADALLSGVETYGFRGEALASMQDLATLDIRSSTDDDGRTYELVVRDGVVLRSGESSAPRAGRGTTVTVRDIFWKFPVRRRPLEKPSAQQSLLTSLRTQLATLALVHPHVSFTLTNTSSSSFALSLIVNSRPISASHSPLHKLLNALFAASSFSRHAPSHLVAPLSSPSRPSSAPASAAKTRQSPRKAAERYPVFVIALEVPSGAVDVSLEPEKRVVEFEDPKRIDRLLTALTHRFLHENGSSSAPPPPAPPPPAASASAPPTSIEPAATPIKRALETSSLATERGKKRSRPGEALDPFAPSPSAARSQTRSAPLPAPPTLDADAGAAASTAKLQRWVDPRTHQAFVVDGRTGNSWREGMRPDLQAREGEGAAEEVEGTGGCERCERGGRERGREGFVDRRGLKRRRGEEDGEEEEMPDWLKGTLDDWHNPIFPTSSTSGTARIPSLPSLPANALTAIAPTLTSAFGSSKPSLSKRPGKGAAAGLTHRKAKEMSAFFSAAGSSLPSDGDAGTAALLPLGGTGEGASAPTRFSREMLHRAEVVAQVDRKFLLVRVPPPPAPSPSPGGQATTLLLLLDQHAASERVRVERFWGEALAGPVARGEEVETRTLEGDERVGVVVGREEEREVRAWEGRFAEWGVRIAPPAPAPAPAPTEDYEPDKEAKEAAKEEADYAQLFLTAVPALLAQRLTAESRTAQDLVRSFVAALRERGAPPCSLEELEAERVRKRERVMGGEEGSRWMSKVKDAPPVLVELVNSKACRGAVMFNDELTPAQSATLLQSLSQTAFPFQCAHGRPSAVPLVHLPSSSSGKVGKGREVLDWGRFV
ncbi:hypothetical protein JCM8097_000771 [Rhodosporidiobolus ruineniae]